MKAIMNESKTFPCLECRGGKRWKPGTKPTDVVEEAMHRANHTVYYLRNVEDCPVCKGNEEIENPGIRR